MSRAFRVPALMLVTDSARAPVGSEPSGWLATRVSQAVDGGVVIVQLRERELGTEALIAVGRRVRDAVAGRALLFVNGDVEAAIALRADGLHLPESAPLRPAPADMVLSRAVHSVDAARRASAGGADLLIAGSVFASASHPGGEMIGVEGLRAICAAVAIPVIAIGGITADSAARVVDAGAAGVAAISAIFDAPDQRAAARAIRAAMLAATPARA